MKLKFKDGTIIEVSDAKGKSKEEIIEEAKKVYKDFRDSQKSVKDSKKVKDEEITPKDEDITPLEVIKMISEPLEDEFNLIPNKEELKNKSKINNLLNYLSSNLNSNVSFDFLMSCFSEIKELGDTLFVEEYNYFTKEASEIIKNKCINVFYEICKEYNLNSFNPKIKEFISYLEDYHNRKSSYVNMYKDSKQVKDAYFKVEKPYKRATYEDPAEYPEVTIESSYSDNYLTDDYIYSVDYKENFGTFNEILDNEFELVEDTNERIEAYRLLDINPEEDYNIYKNKSLVIDNTSKNYKQGSYFLEYDIKDLFIYDRKDIEEELYEEWENYEPGLD